ncbi:MAG TPA: hypothetical protein VL094_10480 [Sphingomonadaceae bacterium]|nr:hypothetical protein [Sphingomonadaceae bacterium]
MVRGLKAFAACSALILAFPGAAHAAEGLACMGNSYDQERRSKIAAMSENFSMSDEEGTTSSEDLAEVAIEAADKCMAQEGWSEEALYYAGIYEISRLSELAYRNSGRLTADELSKLDEALNRSERPALWNALERAVEAGLKGEEAGMTSKEEFVMGSFVISAGLGADEVAAEKVGELLGLMALVRYSKREFEAQFTKE